MNIKVNIPDIGEGEFEVTEILVKVGDKVKIEQSLITVEGNKTALEIPSPQNGVVENIKIITGDKVKTGSLIMVLKDESCINFDKDIQGLLNLDQSNENFVHATPVVRRLANKFDIDLTKVKGTGRKNRILKECVYDYIKESVKFFELSSRNKINNFNEVNKQSLHENISNIDKYNDFEEIKLSHIQKISSSNLTKNWQTIPHVTLFEKIDVTNLEEFRNKQNIEIKKTNPNEKISLLAFIMKAVNYSINQMPRFNSSLSTDFKKVIIKKNINIGVAVDTPKGIVVPVFKGINQKSILQLSTELIDVSKKAIKGQLTPENMQDGTFTISSLGNIGTTFFTPIVNAPEVAILGISKFSIESVWHDKEFSPRLMLPISLSFDHRVIDGADGARFIKFISNILTDIRLLII
ncbi:dihydrolipoamide acetyltransferase [Candidatus Pantoea edessiphila]|uniref:Dihydrolipoamide acetyltransferase component of pyruvate dehydrogenase complex n=1 Tax=Candidatus Pantoea edessiphila TaxID=2044610 RepID=A0A2P5T242_9GAMM|nr:2-oxo acid dehydrogenase subunit E2 [Candidatus Pantoea edessiphila]PPI88659.1 dihydrolipoamide acetyltransferase [Candidatus Pantoea edessiphila]